MEKIENVTVDKSVFKMWIKILEELPYSHPDIRYVIDQMKSSS